MRRETTAGFVAGAVALAGCGDSGGTGIQSSADVWFLWAFMVLMIQPLVCIGETVKTKGVGERIPIVGALAVSLLGAFALTRALLGQDGLSEAYDYVYGVASSGDDVWWKGFAAGFAYIGVSRLWRLVARFFPRGVRIGAMGVLAVPCAATVAVLGGGGEALEYIPPGSRVAGLSFGFAIGALLVAAPFIYRDWTSPDQLNEALGLGEKEEESHSDGRNEPF